MSLLDRARELRRDMTLPERMLWNRIRDSQLGPKFRRQVPKGLYVLDFFCPQAKLVVEVDGDLSHDERFVHDAVRTAWLESQGYRVIRFEATEVMVDLDDVVEQLWLIVNERVVGPGRWLP